MRKYLFLFLLLIIGSAQLYAEKVSFVINAPKTVVKGAQFQLQYILKGGSGKDIEVPDEVKGFDVLFGPSVSTMHSTSIINGKRTSESNTTYTYLLMAKDEGTFTLPEASIVADGAHYKSGTSQIKVLPPDKNAQPQEPGRQPQAIVQKSKGTVDANDAFIRAIFSKTKIHEQEAVVATFKFYTVLNISEVGKIEFPEFEGFMVEDFDLPVNRQWEMEHYNGRNYMTLEVKKSLLFPQRSGKITIPSGSMDIIFEISSGKVINHPLFGPQEVMTEAKKKLTTQPVTLDISPLPTAGKPLGFSGGVGSFDIKSSVTDTKIKANDAVTLKISITGSGNMKLIRNPELDLDKNIEAYDPKVDNKFVIGANGLTGTKSVEYLLIPRYPGKYTIPAIDFSFYDVNSKKYKTVKTEEYTLDVAADPNAGKGGGATSYNNQQEVKVEKDIRYLKIGDFDFVKAKDFRISKSTYILWYIIPFILFVGVLFVYRKQIKANADIARMKTKRANKVATKRLKLAKKYLNEHNKDGYYEEVLKAVWGYLSDKLTIPAAELSRENVEIELAKFGASDELIKEYIAIIDTCEFARYAPADSTKAMDNLYNDTVEAIGNMENIIKIK